MEDDPVVNEYKIFVSTQLSQYLHLFQSASKSHLPSGNGDALPGRFKKISHSFELEVPIDTRHQTYSKDRGEELGTASQVGAIKLIGSQQSASKLLDKVILTGGPVQNVTAKYFVAAIREDGLHMTPLSSIIQVRPTLTYLDDIDSKTKASAKKMSEMDKPAQAEVTKAVQIQFKKKETEEQMAARLNSYAYLKRIVDEEPWIKITHFSHDSQEAEKVAERLFCESSEPLSFKTQDPRDYLENFVKQ